jgi:apolipoprotein N-acyltransferase
MTRWHILAALLCGAVLAIGRDTGQFGWLALAACVPLLVMALRAPRARDVALLMFVPAWMAEAGPMWFYGRLLPMVYGLAVAQALVFMLAALFMRALYRRFPAGVAPLGFAAMLAAIDYLHGLVSPNGSFFALGYTLVDVVPLLQTASLAGVAGLSFLAAVIPAGLAVLCVRPRDAGAALTWSVPVLAALAYGFWQLAQPAGPAVRVALLSDDRYAGRVFNHPEAAPEVAAAFARQIDAAAMHAPAAIVVPEKILAAGTVLVPPAGSSVVAGLDGPAPQGGRLNIAALYRPGAPVQT